MRSTLLALLILLVACGTPPSEKVSSWDPSYIQSIEKAGCEEWNDSCKTPIATACYAGTCVGGPDEDIAAINTIYGKVARRLATICPNPTEMGGGIQTVEVSTGYIHQVRYYRNGKIIGGLLFRDDISKCGGYLYFGEPLSAECCGG